jgi:hypothetical protein
MISGTPMPVVDQPAWEPLHPSNYTINSLTCWADDGVDSIYYFAGGPLLRYGCSSDGWTRLADCPMTLLTSVSMAYTRWGGHFGRALAGGARTISGAFGCGRAAVGCQIRIIGGTGAGQVRTITDVSEPTVEAVIGGGGGSEGATDANRVYARGQWLCRQLRAVSRTGVGSARPVLTLCPSNSTTYVGDASWAKAYSPQFSWSNNLAGTDATTRFAVESATCTVDTDWDVVPDSGSLFEIASGALWVMTNYASNPFSYFYKYDCLFDSWERRAVPVDMMTGSQVTDFHLEAAHDAELAAGAAVGGTRSTLECGAGAFAGNLKGCRVFISAGAGAGQQRTILSNTDSQLTVARPFSVNPAAGSAYRVTPDVDKIWLYSGEYGGLLQYSIEFDDWTCAEIRDYGILGEVAVVTDGGKCCTTLNNMVVASGRATIDSNFTTDIAAGDWVTVSGMQDPQLNGRVQVLYELHWGKISFATAAANVASAPAALRHGPTFYNQILVTGSPTTYDWTGTYSYVGMHNGYPYYRRGSDDWYVWYYVSSISNGNWVLSGGPVGTLISPRWIAGRDIVNTYNGAANPPYPLVANAAGSGVFANATFVDCTKDWTVNEHAGRVLIVPGVAPYKHYITSNTATSVSILTVTNGLSSFVPNASYTTQKYMIVDQNAFGAMPAEDAIPGEVYSNTVTVSGSLTPNAAGVYTVAGIHNGKPYYQRGSESWYIWYMSSNGAWILGQVLGVDGGLWYSWPGHLLGSGYTNGIGVGTVTVSNNADSGIYSSRGHSSGYGRVDLNTINTVQDFEKSWSLNRMSGRIFKMITGLGGQAYGLRPVTTNSCWSFSWSAAMGAGTDLVGNVYCIFSNLPGGLGVKLIHVYGSTDPAVGRRYIYRIKGGNALPPIDRYNIETGAFEEFTTYPNSELFTTGTMAAYDGVNRIYIHHNNTGRILCLDVTTGVMSPFSQVPCMGAALGSAPSGNRMAVMASSDGSKYLYLTRNINSNYEMYRLLLP